MALWQNPVMLTVLVVILLALLITWVVLRKRRRKRESTTIHTELSTGGPKFGDNSGQAARSGSKQKELTPVSDLKISPEKPEKEAVDQYQATDVSKGVSSSGPVTVAGDQFDQIINPDIKLIPDVILEPVEDTILLIFPERVPLEEIKKFEKYLREQEVLKIVTTGGSSDEGSNIGIKILSRVNLTELLSGSNMSIVKHIRKKGERIIVSCKS